MKKTLVESTRLSKAATTADAKTGVLEVEFLTPGWGSSGYYSRRVVEAAAPLFAVGTHLYLDHPTETEQVERPVRSVRDIAAVVTEAGTVDKTTGGVRGKVTATASYRHLLTDETLMENIGLSIRGSATDIVEGEAEGRRGGIIEGLADIASVDFVTRAGRGGRVLQVLESARPSVVIGRAVRRGVEEATADERRTQLGDAVQTAYADGGGGYVWVQDFDDTSVWFTTSTEGEKTRTWEQGYTIADDDMSVALTGDRVEVRPVTTYMPVVLPEAAVTEAAVEAGGADAKFLAAMIVHHEAAIRMAGDYLEATDQAARDRRVGRLAKAIVAAQTSEVTAMRSWLPIGAPGKTTSSDRMPMKESQPNLDVPVHYDPAGRTITDPKEITMGNIQVDEADHRRVTEAAGRVPTLEAERDTEKARAEAAERARDELLARESATTRARKRVTEANATLPTPVVDRIVAEATRTVPLTDAGQLDEAALDTAVDTARTTEESYLTGLVQATGGDALVGFGASAETPVTESKPASNAWGRPLAESKKGA